MSLFYMTYKQTSPRICSLSGSVLSLITFSFDLNRKKCKIREKHMIRKERMKSRKYWTVHTLFLVQINVIVSLQFRYLN